MDKKIIPHQTPEMIARLFMRGHKLETLVTIFETRKIKQASELLKWERKAWRMRLFKEIPWAAEIDAAAASHDAELAIEAVIRGDNKLEQVD